MLFRLPTLLFNTLSYFRFYRIAEKMHMVPVFVVLAFHDVSEFN